MPALVDPQKQGVHHIKDNLLTVPVCQRIRPDRCLLRCHCRRRICSDGGISHIILLVTGRLDTIPGQHSVIHTQAAGGTVFNNKVRILFKNTIQPFQICPVMPQKPVPITVRIHFCANPRFNVVVHFDITHTILIYYPVYDLRGMGTHLRIAEVQLITTSVIDAFSMAHKIPVILYPVCLRAFDPHDLQLQPYTGYHSLGPYVIGNFLNTARETLLGWQPFPHTVPPVSRGIPACVNTEILASRLGSLVNQRYFLLSGRVPKQAVHIIIKDNL